METAKKVYRRKKNEFKWGRFVICAILIAYIVMFVYTFFAQSIEKTNIVYGEVEEVETTYGYITRNEQIVTSDVIGELYPVMNEGERVSKGQSVAIVKNDNSEVISNKIKELMNKLSTFSTPSVFNNDIAILDNDINNMLNSLMLSNYNEKFSTLKDVRNRIEAKLSKKSMIIGEQSAKGTIERGYYDELKAYESQLTSSRNELYAPIAGTVAYKLDGYENVFSFDAISDYDAKTLETLDVSTGELVGSIKPNSFKIVDNIEGYITVIAKSDRALNAIVDRKIKLRFPEISQEEILGKIEYLSIENGQAVITFRINRGIEKLINYRKIKVDIIWNNSSGMLVPSAAIKRDGENNKIFVVNGNRLIKKNVKIVSEWDGSAIIDNVGENVIYLYDSIVADAKNVNEDKMIISK